MRVLLRAVFTHLDATLAESNLSIEKEESLAFPSIDSRTIKLVGVLVV